MMSCKLDDGVLSKTTMLVKRLTLPNGQCKHTNTIKVTRIQGEQNYDLPWISQSNTEQQQNMLKRSIEVRYLKMAYLIKDTYLFSFDFPQAESSQWKQRSLVSENQKNQNSEQSFSGNLEVSSALKVERILLFHKTMAGKNKFLKRNTKNIPKNFCKAFAVYMQGQISKKAQKWNAAMNDYNKLLAKSKFNNILIQQILSSRTIAPFFKQFLENYAQEWIKCSKIEDKDVHFQAIKIYLQLLSKLSYAQDDPDSNQ